MNLTTADLNTLDGWHTAEEHLLLWVLLNTRRMSGFLLNLSTTMIFYSTLHSLFACFFSKSTKSRYPIMCLHQQGCFLISHQYYQDFINDSANVPFDTSLGTLPGLQINIHPRVVLDWCTNYLHTSKSEFPVQCFNSCISIQLPVIIE